MLQTEEIIINDVSIINVSRPDFKRGIDNGNTLVFKEGPRTLSQVCVINNSIIIPDNALLQSWKETFIKYVGKSVKFHKCLNTIYAYEVDGKKTYMKQQFIMPMIFTSVVVGLIFF